MGQDLKQYAPEFDLNFTPRHFVLYEHVEYVTLLDKAQYRVVCPDSNKGKTWEPKKVWKTDKGEVVGVLGEHRHGFAGGWCPWSGLPVPAKQVKSKPDVQVS